ncbi:MAG: hypothetical protein K9J17_05745 [Flavobacteriales bacterium]|nr:hypothetical protein [Flavobacteriales bacterium]
MKNTTEPNESTLHFEGASESDLTRNPFKVPAGYFENLAPRVMENVRASEVDVEKPAIRLTRWLVPSFGIAAMALAAWFFFLPNKSATPDFDTVLASISVQELTYYADLQPTELVGYDLVDYSDATMTQNTLSEEDVIDYLNAEEEMEWNTIIDEIEI